MIKTIIPLVLVSTLLALVLTVEAQQSNVFKVGWLGTAPGSGSASGPEVIRRELHQLGYVEGKTIVFERRYYEGRLDRLPALAEGLVRLKVDLILTSSTPAARALKKATRTIPIVFYSQGDPVVAGLVDSLGRPGGNVTGITSISPLVAGKRIEILMETVIKISSVAVLWTRGQSEQSWKQSELAARELGLRSHSMEVNNAEQFYEAFRKAASTADALTVTPTPIANANRRIIVQLAARNRLPAIYPDTRWADAGGLMSYGADRTERYARVALLADKILKGANPAELPVEQPTKFELVINFKTAKELGVKIPAHLLMAADKVIE
jgi:putative ABC transport system substrate-binding protein